MKRVAMACVVAAAGIAAVLPWPAGAVERWYSTGLYPLLQQPMTGLSNHVPFALADVALVAAISAWLFMAVFQLRRSGRRHIRMALGRIAARTVVAAAVIYLAFLALWGLNYRRLPLERKLRFDAGALTPDAARATTMVAVSRVNELYADAHASGWPQGNRVDPSLAGAFSSVSRDLNGSGHTVPGRPKQTLLNLYFRPAAVDGATDPFFLETLVASDLLPFERPFVVAHEWSHLAGFADEGEANFLGWLTCARAGAAAQYSGWLFLYEQIARVLPPAERTALASRLGAGPRADLKAIRDRVAASVNPQVAAAGWRVYDSYLKSNRVESGARSYDEVVQLALGLEILRTY